MLSSAFSSPAAISRFCEAEGFEVVVTHVEVETGKGSDALDRRPELADAFRLPRRDGAIVAGVVRGGPADAAGVRVGDILVEVEGQPVKDTASMLNLIAQLSPGSRARLRFVRQGQELELPVLIGKRPKAQARREE